MTGNSKMLTKKWACEMRRHRLHLSTVRHESSSEWIFKSKDVLESQDADFEMSQASNVPKTRYLRRKAPLKSKGVTKGGENLCYSTSKYFFIFLF